MRAVIRSLVAWSVTLSLTVGIWLPADSGAFVDADGICGPALAASGAATRFAPDPGQTPQTEHCLFCHWRHTMASASVVALVAIPGPVEAGRVPPGRVSTDPAIVELGHSSPRGPPAIS